MYTCVCFKFLRGIAEVHGLNFELKCKSMKVVRVVARSCAVSFRFWRSLHSRFQTDFLIFSCTGVETDSCFLLRYTAQRKSQSDQFVFVVKTYK